MTEVRDRAPPADALPAKITIRGLVLDYVNPETGEGHRAVECLAPAADKRKAPD